MKIERLSGRPKEVLHQSATERSTPIRRITHRVEQGREAGLSAVRALLAELGNKNKPTDHDTPNEMPAKDEPRPSPDPLPQPQHFRILYDGTLSQKMLWNNAKLLKIEQTGDVRSAITVRTGTERPTVNYVALGDTLAMKGIGNWGDLFTKHKRSSKAIELKINILRASIEIIINDRIIQQEVRDKKGEFNTNFMNKFNGYLAEAIKQALTAEKLEQTWRSTTTVFFGAVGMAVPQAVGLIIIDIGVNVIRLSSGPDVGFFFSGLTLLVGTLTTIFGAGFNLRGGIYAIADLLAMDRRLKSNKNPYFKSWWDLFPPKHIKDLVMSYLYTSAAGRKLVRIEKEEKRKKS